MSNIESNSIWQEWLCLIKIIQPEFLDKDVELVYRIIFENDQQLFSRMLDIHTYKSILKNISIYRYEFVDRDMILDTVKDLVLINGCQDTTIDNYMDWEGFVQAEIDENYVEFNGQYIRYECLEELYRDVKSCIC